MYLPGYPTFLADSNISLIDVLRENEKVSSYTSLPAEPTQFKRQKRTFQKGRNLANTCPNTSHGFYFTSTDISRPIDLQPRAQSAFPQPYSFFDCVPAEVRDNIYGYLVDNVVVRVDSLVHMSSAGTKPSTSVYQNKAPQNEQIYRDAGYSGTEATSNFMCISQRFFREARDVLHRGMTVVFSRRWDFLTACGTQSLYVDGAAPALNRGLRLFPQVPDIFAKIRRLELDLCQSSDFGHRIVTLEVERVTALITKMIATNMPCLRDLTLSLNDCSRISFLEGVFLPEPTFVVSLLAIRQIKTIHLLPGIGWKGCGPRQKVFQYNLAAFELMMQRHYSGVAKIDPQNLAGSNRWVRLASIGRLILSTQHPTTPRNRKAYDHAMKLMCHKVYAIEHGARR